MASELRVDRIAPLNGIATVSQNKGGNAGGGVIQVRHSNTNQTYIANAESPETNWMATGYIGEITPIRSDSKIFIIANPNVMIYQNSGNYSAGSIKIMRSIDSGAYTECSPITIGSQVGNYDYGGTGLITYYNNCFTGFDEPNTTQSVSYQIYMKRLHGTGIRLGYQLVADIGSNGFITMMEVSG